MYRFIKITDNDDWRHFHIDITTMSDPRIRVSILYGNFLDHVYDGIGVSKPIYDIFLKDFSFCTVFRGHFSSMKEAKLKREELQQFYRKRLELYNYTPIPISCVVSFD